MDHEIRTDVHELGLAPEAAGAHIRTFGQVFKSDLIARQQCVPGVFALGDSSQVETVRKESGHIFHAMDGDVDLIRQHRLLDFLNEEPLAADLCQRDIKDLVSRCLYFGERCSHAGIFFFDLRFHPFCLPERQRAASGADPNFFSQ
jgi:hypothetical protein